jgi:hypothetical protein
MALNPDDIAKIKTLHSRRLAPKTQRAYNSGQRVFLGFLAQRFPSVVVNGEIDLSELKIEHFELFLREMLDAQRSTSTLNVRSPSLAAALLIALFEALSDQFLQGYRSALRALFKESDREFPAEWEERLSDFMAGLERMAADQVKAGDRDPSEGKEYLPYELYKWLGEAFLADGDLFSVLYSTLGWNIMCRSSNVAAINLKHLSWKRDHAVVKIHQTKTDQGLDPLLLSLHRSPSAVDEKKMPLAVCANPYNPAECTVTAFGMYFLVYGALPDKNKLFPGGRSSSFCSLPLPQVTRRAE